MSKNRLIWQLFPSYMLVTLLSLLAVTLFASKSLRAFYLNEKKQDLLARVKLVDGQLVAPLKAGDFTKIDRLSKELGRESDMRLTVIMPSGTVVGDTLEDPNVMDNHGDRPEVTAALDGGVGSSVRYSYTIGKNLLYMAVPISSGEELLGIARVSVAVSAINRTFMIIFTKIVMFGIIIALIATIICWIVARRITQPLESLRDGAERFSNGEFNHRISTSGCEEFTELSMTLNNMASQLDRRIKTVIEQRKELETILASMNEGVMMVDNKERIITLNDRLKDFIHIDAPDVKGKMIQEVVRNTTLQRIISDSLNGVESVEDDIIVDNDGERFLHVYATLLSDAKGQKSGVLVVVQDVTRVRQLENVRREFVTNVSHEIKTPLTSIKGFVETLQDGAIDNSEESKRFLGIIAHQTDRLNTLVDDLLVLSRVQRDSEYKEIALTEENLKMVAQSAVTLCQVKAKAKQIDVCVECDEKINAKINALLLEQALVNLIDNAIKYSSEKSKVIVRIEKKSDELLMMVQDQGCGIAAEHLPRLFERFYRVDKGRSRQLGGTGLGLAIVKHIARAHNGSVSVDSIPQKGSTFVVHLPRN